MIVIAGTIGIEPAARDGFVAGTATITADSRAERGCVDYAFSPDPLNPSLVRIIEVWADAGALEAHRAAEHHGVFLEYMRGLPLREINVTQFEVSTHTVL